MGGLMKFFRKDNHAFGILIALVVSIAMYSLLGVFAYFFPETFSSRFLSKQVIVMISIFVNVFPFRVYMVGLKLERTGRGILAAMFVLMILYFIFVHTEQA
jgi:hypothetical protein